MIRSKIDSTFMYYFDQGKCLEAYNVFGLPTTYFIDAEGYLIDSVYKVITKEQLLNGIEKL